MRFGVCFNVEYHLEIHKSPSHYFGAILEQVDQLEELGYDSVWFSEHHSGAYSFGNPAVIAAVAASRTKRIRIGTGVSLLPLQNPIILAEQYAMLDVLSNGRLEYGIGRGYLMHEYEWLKIPVSESHGRYREAAEFITKAWMSNGPFEFHGKYLSVDDYAFFPPPVQRPVPIYASGGGTPQSFTWAAEMGFHLGTALFLPDRDFVRDNIAAYRRTLAEHGFDPASREVSAITQMYCAPTKAQAVEEGGTYTTNYYRFFSKLAGKTAFNPVSEFYAKTDARDLNPGDFVLFGDPEDLIGRIAGVRDTLGIDFLLMEVAQGGTPPEKAAAVIDLFGRYVLPKLQKPSPKA
jgi:alkanesulfonate monooxygenase SsuD/methylene tetrahydromethanopterin reductase-like flavin-dependent oxidoreductase (luciferase family)